MTFWTGVLVAIGAGWVFLTLVAFIGAGVPIIRQKWKEWKHGKSKR